MKFKVGDVLFSRWGTKNQKGRRVLEVVDSVGLWKMPQYKFESKEAKTGFVWTPEYFLCTEEEFIQAVKSGELYEMLV